jgi:hypothetical protein
VSMKDLFNKTFYRFTMGFVSIILVAFLVVVVVTHIDASQGSATAGTSGR